MEDYNHRREDLEKAVRRLSRAGVHVGFLFQAATGEMIFHVDNYTLTAEQILSLLDNNHLDREGIRKVVGIRRSEGV